MTRWTRNLLAAMLGAALLPACILHMPQRPRPLPAAHADLLLATERGMGSLVFDARHGYLALSNTATGPSMVLRSPMVINRASLLAPVDLEACALAAARGGEPLRSPVLVRLDGKIYLHQPTFGSAKEHALCQYERAMEWFAPRDQGLRVCAGLQCDRLWMSDLQAHRGQLFANAGAGPNVLASADDGAAWRALLGRVARHPCRHAPFRIVGNRLLTAGACARDGTDLRAYQLAPDGVSLASDTPLALAVPALEQRHVQFIGQAGEALYAAVEGGLLRSGDGGRGFVFVIAHRPGAARYPVIGSLLALRNRAHVLLAGGFDQASGQPYLAVSGDGGRRWTDISASLPPAEGAANVTSLTQDPLGRILLTLNLDQDARGRLLLLTLAGLD